MPRPIRALGALTIAIAVLLPAAVPAAAREPHRPLPDYHTAFVTQRERGGATSDCLWASAAMLVDKWTAGRVSVAKDRLRRMSGDREKGSNFRDLAPVLRKLGLKARWSPEGGDFVTWSELRARLRKGGGAILLGDYHDLPRWYGRWAPGFWKKKGKKDNHAVYLDRYDARTDRYWVMDPLAPAGWKGEWIPGWAIQAFAWQTGGGGLWVMMTPSAKRAPFAGVKLTAPSAAVAGGKLQVGWHVRKAPKGWRFPRVTVRAKVERLDDPASLGLTAAISAPRAERTARGPRPTARYARKTIVASVETPAEPGAYRVAVSLTERRFGRTAARSSTVLYVPGERRGSIVATDPGAALAGEPLTLGLTVMNTGHLDWGDPEWLTTSAPQALQRRRDTTVRASWQLHAAERGRADPAEADPIDVLEVPLEPGGVKRATVTIPTPSVPGRWVLTLDIVDAVDGSLAAAGSAPRTMVVTLVDARHRTSPGG